MTRRHLALALALALLLPALAVAQQAGQPPAANPAPAQAGSMYEDVEIFRRLLLKKLEPLYPGRNLPWANVTAKQQIGSYYYPSTVESAQWVATPHLDVEGVYLKGHGVVYTLTLPPLPQDPKPTSSPPAAKTLDDWERMRRQVRGEKVEPDNPAKEQKAPSVADILLKALAENGHRFAHLGENESLTIAVTFRDGQHGPYRLHLNRNELDTLDNVFQANTQHTQAIIVPNEDPNNEVLSKQLGNALAETTVPARPTTARDYELLGDLHLRQKNSAKAVEAYRKAVELKPNNLAELYPKLAQAYLAENEAAKAEEALQHARALMAKNTAMTPATAGAALPAKLVISAPKKLLDQVGTGKMSFDDFKKAASVEYVTFPAAEKKP